MPFGEVTVSTSNHLHVSQSDQWIKDLSFKCPHLEFKISRDVGPRNKAKPDQIEFVATPATPPRASFHLWRRNWNTAVSRSLSLRARGGSRCKSISNLKLSFWCFSHCFRSLCRTFSPPLSVSFSIPQMPAPAGFRTITARSCRDCDLCFLWTEKHTCSPFRFFVNLRKCK